MNASKTRVPRGSCAVAALSAATLAWVCPGSSAGAGTSLQAGVASGLAAVEERRDGTGDSSSANATVSASIDLAAATRRASLGANASAVYRRSLDSDRESVEPRLGLRAQGVLVERVLTFEARADSRFRDTSPVADSPALVDDPRAIDDDRFSRVDSLALGPRYRSSLGERTRIGAGYRFGVDRVEDETLGSTRQHSFGLGTISVLGAQGRTALRFDLNADSVDAEGVGASSMSAVASVVHGFAARFAVNLSAGVDRVRADAGGDGNDAADEGGAVYGIGAMWRPSRRVIASVSWIQRSFGGSPAASVSATGRRSVVSLSWWRRLALNRSIDLGAVLPGPGGIGPVGSGVPPSTPVPGAAGPIDTADDVDLDAVDADLPASDDPDRVLFARDVASVEERAVLAWTRTGRLTALSVALSHVRRGSIEGGRGEGSRGTGVAFRASRPLGRRAAFSFDASYGIERGSRENDGEGESRTARVGLSLSMGLR